MRQTRNRKLAPLLALLLATPLMAQETGEDGAEGVGFGGSDDGSSEARDAEVQALQERIRQLESSQLERERTLQAMGSEFSRGADAAEALLESNRAASAQREAQLAERARDQTLASEASAWLQSANEAFIVSLSDAPMLNAMAEARSRLIVIRNSSSDASSAQRARAALAAIEQARAYFDHREKPLARNALLEAWRHSRAVAP